MLNHKIDPQKLRWRFAALYLGIYMASLAVYAAATLGLLP